jgi:hypothetical protein
VSATTVTFSSAQAGKEIIVAYSEALTANTTSLDAATNNAVFRLAVMGEAVKSKDEGTVKKDHLIVDRVSVDGDVSMPDRENQPKPWTVTFKIQEPRTGYKVLDYYVEA